jgi:diadenosine tetraphosphate (Ap4A) HIT family hydrolase
MAESSACWFNGTTDDFRLRTTMDCVFCREDGGDVLWQDVAEFSDLAESDRDRVMRAVYAVERAMRRILQPVKVNLASLGNQVPHVHWHVIPRFSNDAHFPLPIWAPRQRTVSEALLSSRRAQATLLRDAVRQEIEQALA